MSKHPYAAVDLAEPLVEVQHNEDGSVLLRSPRELTSYPNSIIERLRHWAEQTPDNTFLGERDSDGNWRRETYASVLAAVESIAQALLDLGMRPGKPLVILSQNSIDHALLSLGAIYVGIPVTAVSTAYSLISTDHQKLRQIIEVLDPGLVYVADAGQYARALDAIDLSQRLLVASTNQQMFAGAIPFSELLRASPGAETAEAAARVGPDTVAKVLFTSGSTGTPKGVINTQRMLCSNQQAISQVWPFLNQEPPVILDWLPWSHTFGSNHNFNMALFNGGSLYIDEGKPVPGLIEKTLANIVDIRPNIFFNVPAGFDALIPHLERDQALRDAFYQRLKVIFYAGAALPQHLWEQLETLAVVARGERIPFVSGWGATETSPLVGSVHYITESSDVIGLPIPGCSIKMVPSGSKMELRVKGPNVTPGYWKDPEKTRQAFDAEGFYKMGDAGRFADPANPLRGLSFDGRIAEDFKLLSGTWVNVGAIRTAAISAAKPVIQDAVVAGHNEDEIGLLAFANLAGCRRLCPERSEAGLDQLIADRRVREAVLAGIGRYNVENGSNSRRIARVLLMSEPASVDAGEITDKGYINQRAVLERRSALVSHLYNADARDADVIVL